ncbi:MAG: ABC transporter substrate-binding protein [Thaumarchaeota archaeon]|nr:ABC transporter substrate-binding protein [Nitrososphaerota archaeon]
MTDPKATKNRKVQNRTNIPFSRVLEQSISRRQALTSAAKVGIGAGIAVVVAGGAAAYFATKPAQTVTSTQVSTSVATSTATTTATSTSTATSTATTTATSVSTVSQTSNTGPVLGGTLVSLEGESFTVMQGQMDPVTETFTPDWWTLPIYDKLMIYGPYPSTSLAPSLGTSYSFSSDGLTMTVPLRTDVTWHDGSAFTSADVVYSFNQYLSTTSGYANQGSIAGWLASVSAPDAHTVAFKLTQPSITAPYWLASFLCPIIPAARAADPKNFYKNPMGTGPFIYGEENDTASYISYTANKNYWGGAPYLDGLQWTGSADASEIIAGFASGSYQFGEAPVLGTAIAEIGTLGNAHLQVQYFPIGQYDVTMNTAATVGGNPNPFANKTIRQAVCYGINWAQILSLYGGLYNRAYQPVTPSYSCYNTTAPKYDYNPTMAASLLQQAGFESGTAIDFVIYSGRLPSELAIIQNSLQNLGFVVNLNIVDAAVFYNSYMIVASEPEDPTHPWNITMQSNGVSIPDPAPLYEAYMYSKSTDWNPAHYSDPAADALYEQAVASTDATERNTLFTQLTGMFVDCGKQPRRSVAEPTLPDHLQPSILQAVDVITSTRFSFSTARATGSLMC